MMRDPGFYIMDEPESALSFTSCLQLVALMHQLATTRAQVLCATQEHWRRYLDNPEFYLRHLLGDDVEADQE
jgi:predicted ATPase